MSEPEEARSHTRHLEQVHSSCQICWSRISELDRQVYIHCWALCRRHRNDVTVGGGAFAVDVVERLGSVRRVDRNTCRYDDDGCSSCRSCCA